MKYIVSLCLVLLFVVGCFEKPKKKFFIKSVKVSEDVRIDWYVYSSITSLAPDYLQISTKDENPFFISFYLTDIHFNHDTLFISMWKEGYEKLDESILKGIRVLVDTTGQQWNGASSRFGRLKRTGVNIEEPHFVDVYCPKGECYNFRDLPH